LPVAAGVVVAVNVTAEVTKAGLDDVVSVSTGVTLLTLRGIVWLADGA
jgi:hypothetical protein